MSSTNEAEYFVRHEHGSDRVSIEEARRGARLPIVGVLDNIRSAHNVGSMFRSADGAGFAELVLCGYSPQPPHRHLAKTALGAVEVVPWRHFEKVEDAIAELRAAGFLHIVAMEKTASSIDLREYAPRFPLAIVMGNEATGLCDETLSRCDAVLHLPMRGLKNSLNVSVAFGIAAYQTAALHENISSSP